jgi:hypothetical protein
MLKNKAAIRLLTSWHLLKFTSGKFRFCLLEDIVKLLAARSEIMCEKGGRAFHTLATGVNRNPAPSHEKGIHFGIIAGAKRVISRIRRFRRPQ